MTSSPTASSDTTAALNAQEYLIEACQNCRATDALEAHHIVPRKNGGRDCQTNIVLLCSDCHDAVHHDRPAPTATSPNHNLGEYGVTPTSGQLEPMDRPRLSRQRRLDEF
jgi:hypothetical protein